VEKEIVIVEKNLAVPADAVWIKSRRSGPISDNCVEAAAIPGGVAVRDSKNPAGPALLFTTDEWDAFVVGAKDGDFDDLI
jgi:hypothetical protein